MPTRIATRPRFVQPWKPKSTQFPTKWLRIFGSARRLLLTSLRRGQAVSPTKGEASMLHWAAIFFVIAIVAAVFGFGGIAVESAWIAKILFGVFVVMAILSLIVGRRPAV